MPRAVLVAPACVPLASLPPAACDVLRVWHYADLTCFEQLQAEVSTTLCKHGPLAEKDFAKHLAQIPVDIRLAYDIQSFVAAHQQRRICGQIDMLVCEAHAFWAAIDQDMLKEL